MEYISTIHSSLLQKLLEYSSYEQVHKLLRKLKDRLKNLHSKRIAVAYGGGKDSTYVIALLRAAQLLSLREYNSTFEIVVIVNYQSHMTKTVLKNIDNTLSTLGMLRDHRIKSFIVHGAVVTELSVSTTTSSLKIPDKIIERDRSDLLIAGHLTHGEPRRIYCDFCNLYMQFGELKVLTTFGNECDLIITGDSLRELSFYRKWIKKLGVLTSDNSCAELFSFAGYMQCIRGIAEKYFLYVHNEVPKMYRDLLRSSFPARFPELFSVYADVQYSADYHLNMLKFLKFKFSPNDLTAVFTETDCSAPALMWHIHALKCKHQMSRTYENGAIEYAKFAVDLMKTKEFPEKMQREQYHRYSKKSHEMRQVVSQHYQRTLQLTEDHLICIIYSPFTNQAKNLVQYLHEQQPRLLPNFNNLYRALKDKNFEISRTTRKRLEECSGLTFEQMQLLFQKKAFLPRVGTTLKNVTWQNVDSSLKFFQMLQEWDPHKKVVYSPISQEHHRYLELSGR